MAVLKSVQTGTTTLTAASSNTATITSITTTNSILFCSYSRASTTADSWAILPEITNSTTLTFSRGNATGNITIKWFLAEFTSGVTTQKIDTENTDFSDAGGYSDYTATISSVGSAAFAISDNITTLGNFDDRWITSADITGATTMLLRRHDRTTPSGYDGSIQVVDITSGATVTAGSVALTGASATDTVSITDINKCALFFSQHYEDEPTSDATEKYGVRSEITNTTTVTFTRNTSSTNITIEYYLVEWTDDTIVRHGSISFGTTDTAVSDTFSALNDVDNAVVYIGGTCNTGGESDGTTDDLGDNGAEVTSLTSTSIELTRASTGQTAEIPYYVIDFSAVDGATFVPKIMMF